MSKTKEYSIKISGWAVMIIFIISAIFANDGLAVDPGAFGWVTPVANFFSNIAPVYGLLAALLTGLIIVIAVATSDDSPNMITAVVGTAIKAADYDIAKAQKVLRFKPFAMTLIAIYWIFIIGAGWLWTGLLFMFAGLSMQLFAAMQRKGLSEIAEDEMSKEELIVLVEKLTKKK